MAVFPGDMNIGWGFGLEHCTGSPTCQCSECRLTEHNANEAPEDQINDPLLAVSELEQRVNNLEERLRSLVFVVNTLCASMHDVMHQEKE